MSSPWLLGTTPLDTFYNSLNSNDQDALDSAAGGNFLDKMPQEGLAIIESKSKVRYSRSHANDLRVSTDAPLSNSLSSNNSFDMQQIAAFLEELDERECIIKQRGPIHLVADETVYKEWEDRMERDTTNSASFSVIGPRCQVTILGGAKAQTRFEAASKQSNDPSLSRVNILGSGEDSMKLNELMELCKKLSDISVRNALCNEIEVNVGNSNLMLLALGCSITRRVESLNDEGLGAQEDASKHGRSIKDIGKDAKVSLVDETQGRSNDTEMFDTDALIVSTAAPSTTAASPPVITEVEITLA
ncbi:hypothetical protein Tco_1144244 [Tanacetum coccineum]